MPDSLQPQLVAISTVFLVLSILIVGLRCWTGYVTASHKLGLDDWFAAATIPFIVIQTALVYHCISLGLGTPSATLPSENIETIKRLLFVSSFFFNTAIVLPKFSALAFYNRIFGRTVRWFHFSLWILVIVNAAWLLTAYFLLGLQCRPTSAIWTSTDGEPHCVPQWEWLTGLAAPSSLIDLIILILPMRLLWGVQASMQRKIVMTAVFAAGYCVMIVSLGRLITLAIDRDGIAADPTYSPVGYLEWVQCEAPVSAISVSLPNIFTLARRMQEHGNIFILTGRPSATNPPPLPPKSPGNLLSPSALRSPNIMFSPLVEKPRGDTWFDNASISTASSRRKNQRRERRGRVGNSRLDSYPTRTSVPTKTLEFSDARTIAFTAPGRPVALTLPPRTLPRRDRKKSTPRLPLLAALASPTSVTSSSPRSPKTPGKPKTPTSAHIVSQARRTFMALSPRAVELPPSPSTPPMSARPTLHSPAIATIPELPERSSPPRARKESQAQPLLQSSPAPAHIAQINVQRAGQHASVYPSIESQSQAPSIAVSPTTPAHPGLQWALYTHPGAAISPRSPRSPVSPLPPTSPTPLSPGPASVPLSPMPLSPVGASRWDVDGPARTAALNAGGYFAYGVWKRDREREGRGDELV